MPGPELGKRGRNLRARLDALREAEALAGAGIDELHAGLERACARVNDARPETSGADRLNPQHWGYSLYVHFRDRIVIACTILPVTEPSPHRTLLQVEVSVNYPRPLMILTLERTSPAAAEWRAHGVRIDPEVFFLDLLDRYAGRWIGD